MRIETNPVHLRLTPEDRSALKSEAEHYGMTMTNLIRKRITQEKIVSVCDMKMIRELRRQGGYGVELCQKTKTVIVGERE